MNEDKENRLQISLEAAALELAAASLASTQLLASGKDGYLKNSKIYADICRIQRSVRRVQAAAAKRLIQIEKLLRAPSAERP